jgi:hypothetical protein
MKQFSLQQIQFAVDESLALEQITDSFQAFRQGRVQPMHVGRLLRSAWRLSRQRRIHLWITHFRGQGGDGLLLKCRSGTTTVRRVRGCYEHRDRRSPGTPL